MAEKRIISELHEKKEVYKKIQAQLLKICDLNIIRDYVNYTGLRDSLQKEIKEQWEAYYETVKQSEASTRFQDMRRAIESNDMTAVRILRQTAKEMLEQGEFMPKPTHPDPFAYGYDGSVIYYQQLRSRLSWLSNDIKKLEEANNNSDFDL